MTNKTSESQRRAFANYRKKNQGKARLPGVILDDSEAVLLEEMGAKFGSKKAAIIAGLKKLKETSGD